MPRTPRTVAPGVPLHIVQRGNNRAPCFFEVRDFDQYLHYLLRASLTERCRVHAYCLMSNHVHLLVTPESETAGARFMKAVNQCYTQYVNRVRGRTGTLWEGRYRSSVVYALRYVLACYRYIELNPVRAGIVRHPADYPWSSFGANADGLDNPLIRPHGAYAALGHSAATRRAAYRALVDESITAPLVDNIRMAIGKGRTLRDGAPGGGAELSTGV
jgi:putative transposase